MRWRYKENAKRQLRTGLLTGAMVLAGGGCASPGNPATVKPVPLAGTHWILGEAWGQRVAQSMGGESISIQFDAELRRASGFAGVNRFSGSYELREGQLTFGPIAATRRAGPPEAEAVETAVFKALDQTRGWRVTGGSLELLGETGAVVARFDALPATP